MLRFVVKSLLVTWALPASAIGLGLGAAALATGGRARWRCGAIEFAGGWLTAFLRTIPPGAIAMTLGHVIIGCNLHALEAAGEHERVHVRQYERWGPLFIPAYLLCSLGLWFAGRHAYLDNPFERQAYREAP